MALCIYVEKLNPDARMPIKAYEGDAGFDIHACEECLIHPHEKQIVGTGLRFAIPGGYAGFIGDKSGLAAHHGLKTLAGVLDSNYRGELKIVLANLGREPYKVEKGQKIAQLIIKKVESPRFIETKIEDATERGGKGFGSSGL